MELKEKIKRWKKAGRLTVEQVKSWEIFKGINDEQAKEVIDSIRQFVIIFFDHYHSPRRKKQVNELTENLNCAA